MKSTGHLLLFSLLAHSVLVFCSPNDFNFLDFEVMKKQRKELDKSLKMNISQRVEMARKRVSAIERIVQDRGSALRDFPKEHQDADQNIHSEKRKLSQHKRALKLAKGAHYYFR